jgi:hypothetical protein
VQTYLYTGFASEAHQHEEQDRDNVVVEAGPVVNAERSYKGSHQHEEYRSRAEDRSTHQHHLWNDGKVVISSTQYFKNQQRLAKLSYTTLGFYVAERENFT